METAASFEARNAPSSYPTGPRLDRTRPMLSPLHNSRRFAVGAHDGNASEARLSGGAAA